MGFSLPPNWLADCVLLLTISNLLLRRENVLATLHFAIQFKVFLSFTCNCVLIEISEIFWSTSKVSNVEFKRVVRMKFWFSLLISFKLLNGLKIIIMKRVFFF